MTRRAAAVLALGALGVGALAGSGANASPRVSPDRIVFASNRAENLEPDVFAVGVGRYSRRNLTSTLLASEAHPQVSPDGRRILFKRSFAGTTSIYVMDRDGRNGRALGPGDNEMWSPDGARIAYVERAEILVREVEGSAVARVATGFLPSWSPDGSRLAFVRVLAQGVGFFVVGADGRGERRVASGHAYGGVVTDAPRWSPDGRRLAVQSGEVGGRASVTVVDVGTGDARQLTPGVHPRWSPDGSLIAFAAQDQRNAPISVVAPDGSGLRALATGPAGPSAFDDFPAWSPNGRRLVFLRRSGRGRGEQVFVVGVDGTGLRRVTRESPRSVFFQYDGPSWLNGRTVVFSSHLLDNDFDLYSVRSDGVALLRLTANDVDEREPVWSPDGRRIAFTRGPEGRSAIWTMAAGGRDARRVSPRSAGSAVSPSWSPSGRQIAFAGVYRNAAALFVVNADGSGLRRVRGPSDGGIADVSVDWSPDGSRLVYAWEPTPSQLFVVSVRGGRPRKLTRGRSENLSPRWSPDGRTVAFVRVTSCGRSCDRAALTTVVVGRSRLRRLVENAFDPSWSADGSRFVFALGGRIATARRDGSGVTYVTVRRGPQTDRYPDWRR